MRLRTQLRISPIVWIAPVLALLAMLYTTRLPPPSDLYLLGLTARATLTIFFVAPVCAACAAWEGGRLRRAGWWEVPHVRSAFMVALAAIFPVFLMGLLVIVAVFVFVLLQTGMYTLPDLRLMLLSSSMIAAYTLLGFGLGLHIRPVIVVPALLLVVYAWLTFPAATDPPWFRHLTGLFLGFDVATDVAPQALAGAIAVVGGVAGTAIVLLRRQLSVPQYIMAIVPTVFALFVGTFLVQDLGYNPIIPRDAALLECSQSQPRVCVWPEHRARLAEVAAIASDAAAQWQQIGIAVPREFSERTNLDVYDRNFGFSSQSQRGDIISALSYTLLPPWKECAYDTPPPYPESPFAEDNLQAWLLATAGMPQADLASRVTNPAIIDTIAMVQSMPVDKQQQWFQQNMAAYQACDWPPPLEASR